MLIKKEKFLDKILFMYFILMSIENVTQFYVVKGNILFILLNNSLRVFSLIFPVIIMLINKPKLNRYRFYFGLIFIVISIRTIIDIIFNYNGNITYIAIYLSILSAFYLQNIGINVFLKPLKIVGELSLISIIYILVFVGININLVLIRAYSWGEIFYFATLFWGVIPFVLLTIIEKKYIKIGLLYWGGGLFLNLILLKRFFFVDSIILIIMLLILLASENKIKISNIIKVFIILIIITTFIIIFFNKEFNNIITVFIDRFNDVEKLSDFDRFVEFKNYLKNINFSDLIIGNGFLGTHEGLGHTSYALHCGWMNLILKGGLLLFFSVIIPTIKAIFLLTKIKYLDNKTKFSVLIVVIYSIRLIYSNMHAFYPEMLMFFWCMFNIMDFKIIKNKF